MDQTISRDFHPTPMPLGSFRLPYPQSWLNLAIPGPSWAAWTLDLSLPECLRWRRGLAASTNAQCHGLTKYHKHNKINKWSYSIHVWFTLIHLLYDDCIVLSYSIVWPALLASNIVIASWQNLAKSNDQMPDLKPGVWNAWCRACSCWLRLKHVEAC